MPTSLPAPIARSSSFACCATAYGRAEVEQVLSGPGLVNLHRFTHRGGECAIVDDLDAPDAPAAVSKAGLGGRCQGCAEALRMFVSAYGAEAGQPCASRPGARWRLRRRRHRAEDPAGASRTAGSCRRFSTRHR